MKKVLFLSLIGLLASFMASLAGAVNLGVYGAVFPIIEPDMLTFIYQRLNQLQENGQLTVMERQFQQTVLEHTLRPTPVSGVSTTVKPRTYDYDPSITVQDDIYDANGHVIIPAGARVNPLNKLQLQETLLFINADDSSQIAWAKTQKKKIGIVKIILVNGNIAKASQQLGRIYFDQYGRICHQFHIEQVPAKVKQMGNQLEIQEVIP